MTRFFRKFWDAIIAFGGLVGVLYIPADVFGFFETYPAMRWVSEVFDRFTVLAIFSGLLAFYIAWIDIRPFMQFLRTRIVFDKDYDLLRTNGEYLSRVQVVPRTHAVLHDAEAYLVSLSLLDGGVAKMLNGNNRMRLPWAGTNSPYSPKRLTSAEVFGFLKVSPDGEKLAIHSHTELASFTCQNDLPHGEYLAVLSVSHKQGETRQSVRFAWDGSVDNLVLRRA